MGEVDAMAGCLLLPFQDAGAASSMPSWKARLYRQGRTVGALLQRQPYKQTDLRPLYSPTCASYRFCDVPWQRERGDREAGMGRV